MKIIIIPARMQSERFPGKPLHHIAGKPLIQWTYERAKQSQANQVVVATDGDFYLEKWCRINEVPYISTDPDLPNGTARCVEAVKSIDRTVDRIINLQVDEPFIPVTYLNILLNYQQNPIMTLVCRSDDADAVICLNNVKAAYSIGTMKTHWFSRMPISNWIHVGVYSFRPDILNDLGRLSPSANSEFENLEQLTWIDNSHEIRANMMLKSETPLSINTIEDAKKAEKMLG